MSLVREISPAVNASADEFLASLPPTFQEIVHRIRREKAAGTRPKPSSMLVDASQLLDAQKRHAILDRVAGLVDENLSGRSDMCQHFADLLCRALVHLKIPARTACGEAIYYDANGREHFRWSHAWVRVGDEVIDGNVDSLAENPMVPDSVKINPYWGPIRKTPADRKLREQRGLTLESESDVTHIWWPELRQWLDQDFFC
jgi:hypothetical protein